MAAIVVEVLHAATSVFRGADLPVGVVSVVGPFLERVLAGEQLFVIGVVEVGRVASRIDLAGQDVRAVVVEVRGVEECCACRGFPGEAVVFPVPGVPALVDHDGQV